MADERSVTFEACLRSMYVELRVLKHRVRRAERAALLWKALARKLWRFPGPNRGGTGRWGCAAIDVRMRRHGHLPPGEAARAAAERGEKGQGDA